MRIVYIKDRQGAENQGEKVGFYNENANLGYILPVFIPLQHRIS
jgi:hypothetical protein